MPDCRIIFKLHTFHLGKSIHIPHSGKEFGLFNGVYTKVGFHIKVHIKHIFGVARFLGD